MKQIFMYLFLSVIDRQEKVVNMNAPHPDTKEIYAEINELLME